MTAAIIRRGTDGLIRFAYFRLMGSVADVLATVSNDGQ